MVEYLVGVQLGLCRRLAKFMGECGANMGECQSSCVVHFACVLMCRCYCQCVSCLFMRIMCVLAYLCYCNKYGAVHVSMMVWSKIYGLRLICPCLCLHINVLLVNGLLVLSYMNVPYVSTKYIFWGVCFEVGNAMEEWSLSFIINQPKIDGDGVLVMYFDIYVCTIPTILVIIAYSHYPRTHTLYYMNWQLDYPFA